MFMIKYGLKLWSADKQWFAEAVELCKQGKIDFIELYIVPNSFDEESWQILKQAPVVVHSQHSGHGFNIFDLDNEKIKTFQEQIIRAADFFNSQFIIVHAGVGRDKEVFRSNIAKIFDKRILIENMPKVSMDDKICFGHLIEELEAIKKESDIDICLDFGHSFCSSLSQGLDYKDFIKSTMERLCPTYFHLSGIDPKSEKDFHLNLYESDVSIIKWIKEILQKVADRQDINLVFEVPKNNIDLANDLKNIDYFKSL